jgi:hypothetical protein
MDEMDEKTRLHGFIISARQWSGLWVLGYSGTLLHQYRAVIGQK